MDDPRSRGPQDRSRVNVDDESEVRWWCVQFNCTEEKLKRAVAKVGVISESVRKELREIYA